MSKNLEIMQGHYAGSDAKDLAAMLAPLSPTTEWTEMAGFPCAGTFVGPDAVVENVFKVLGTEWDGYTLKVDRLLDAGNSIIAVGTYSGTYRKTGKEMTARVVHVWDLADGKVTKFEQFTDTAMVAAAMR